MVRQIGLRHEVGLDSEVDVEVVFPFIREIRSKAGESDPRRRQLPFLFLVLPQIPTRLELNGAIGAGKLLQWCDDRIDLDGRIERCLKQGGSCSETAFTCKVEGLLDKRE